MMTNVVMPQMGESIAEGTIVRWIKKVGDNVDRDEPLFEISTDKVDAEIPSPAAGVLTEIKVKEGETVPVDTVVAVIGAGRRSAARLPRRQPARECRHRAAAATSASRSAGTVGAAAASDSAGRPCRRRRPGQPPDAGDGRARSCGARSRRRSCGRSRASTTSTSADHRDRHQRPRHQAATSSASSRPAQAPPPPARAAAPRGAGARHVPAYKPGESVEIVPMTVMRKKIAEHMVLSAHTSAHVYSVYEVDFTPRRRRSARRRRPSTSAPARS